MGKKSRTKGASGERDIVAMDSTFGFVSFRTAPMQAGHGDADWDDVACQTYPLNLLRREVKRYRKVPIARFIREYVMPEAKPGCINTLIHRDDNSEWMVTVKYEELLKILSAWRNDKNDLLELRQRCHLE